MEKTQLINKVEDIWTDNIYGNIRDIIEAYTLEYEREELDEIIEKVIATMVKRHLYYNSRKRCSGSLMTYILH